MSERIGTLAVPQGVAMREGSGKMTPEIKAACNLLATLHRDSGSGITRISGQGGEFEIIVVTLAKAKVAITFKEPVTSQAGPSTPGADLQTPDVLERGMR
jgi:hypothetical protein